jgi:hypothetical protein
MPAVPDNGAMDETPEELAQIRREAELIDPQQYRKRSRLIAAVALGALGAGLVWGALELIDKRRNPCERLRTHYCQDAASLNCKTYDSLYRESIEDESNKMRSMIKSQCETKIERLKGEENIRVR